MYSALLISEKKRREKRRSRSEWEKERERGCERAREIKGKYF